jgi:uncharacterized protein (DUF2252 family)
MPMCAGQRSSFTSAWNHLGASACPKDHRFGFVVIDVGNLGPVANASGRVALAIRDLDQTVIGNPAHDLIRLGLSLATAIRSSDLPAVTTALVLEQMAEGYIEALGNGGRGRKPSSTPPAAVRRILERPLTLQAPRRSGLLNV